jgi:hypothetical protein
MLKGKGEDASAVMAEVRPEGELEANEGRLDELLKELMTRFVFDHPQPAAGKRAGSGKRTPTTSKCSLGHAAQLRFSGQGPRRPGRGAGQLDFEAACQDRRRALYS